MPPRALANTLALAIAFLLLAAGLILIFQRNGVLAWLGLVVGAGLLVKFWRRPSWSDLLVSSASATLWVLAWVGIFAYVISTWESGEVVELTVTTSSGDHTARTWIMDQPAVLLLYYDAPELAANALLSGAPIDVRRGEKQLPIERYSAVDVEKLPEDEVERLLGLMSEKYGDRVAAADLFYGFLGRSRGRVGLKIEIPR